MPNFYKNHILTQKATHSTTGKEYSGILPWTML